MAQANAGFRQEFFGQRKDFEPGIFRSAYEVGGGCVGECSLDAQSVLGKQPLTFAPAGGRLELYEKILGVNEVPTRTSLHQCAPGELECRVALEHLASPVAQRA